MENSDNDNEIYIYASLACMSSNYESFSRYVGDSSELNNLTLDLGAMCHMTPKVSDFIPGSLEDMNEYTELMDGNNAMAEQKRQFQIKMCDNNRDTFIAILHNIILAPDLCDGLF